MLTTADPKSPMRRDLLKSIGAAAFVVAFHVPSRVLAATQAVAHRFNAFLLIGNDDIVTVLVAQTEGGQGSSTGIPQVIASELGAEWTKVRYQFTTERLPEYINPLLYEGLVLTAGSSSITGFYDSYRRAAATTREMLTTAAARKWGVPAAECKVTNSKVTHAATARSASFGELASLAMKEAVPASPKLRAKNELTYVGKPLARLDVPSKTNGSARFGLDADVPGMLYAAVRHSPAYGAKIQVIDDSEAKGMPGVKLITAVPQGVAVVADQYWQAVKALEKVKETYAPHANDHASTATLTQALIDGLGRKGVTTPGTRGDARGALAKSAKVISAEYSFPILAHACMEPVSCTAFVQGNHCELWLSTKSTTLDGGFAAEALGIDPATVIIHNEFQGGDFGRRSGREHTTEAVLLAKAAGRPVKVVWTREEDLRMEQHRTAVLARASIGLNKDGMPIAWDAKLASDGVWRSLFPRWYAKKKPLDLPLFSLAGSFYEIPNEAGEYVLVEHPVRVGAFRGNNEVHNGFMWETLIDEAAVYAKRDPLAYRQALLAKDERSLVVLERLAKLSKWGKPKTGRFVGLSFYRSEFYRCRIAAVAELSKMKGGLKVEHIYCVADAGLIINPNLAEQNIECGLIFGLSNVMYEQITLEKGGPTQKNFGDYRLLRMSEAPETTVEVISVGDEPGSIGEIGVFPVGAAVANAIYRATGKRVRTQPFANSVTFV